MLQLSEAEVRGTAFKQASASVTGQGVYGALKWESGVHRVQRVPTTETAGRVHTSTASVAVLPQADAVSTAVVHGQPPLQACNCVLAGSCC